jgi:oxygen-independent coproporphyrinogen-3 oxidase
VDLIYGLPHQSVESIKPTLDTVLNELNPDRLALYHYAHLPHIFKPQRRIDTEAVPSSEEKLDILQYAVHLLDEKGYVFIGMDHFAKPEDELAIALKEGRLQRNFQGYSTHADCDLVAIGVSSIGKVGNTYSQNQKELPEYYADLDAGRLPILRGFQLNDDDVLRRQVIQDLMCRFALELSDYGVDFKTYFADEMPDLDNMAKLGLIEWNALSGSLKVTPKGRFLIRNIAMIFDYHLRHKETQAKYSQTV